MLYNVSGTGTMELHSPVTDAMIGDKWMIHADQPDIYGYDLYYSGDPTPEFQVEGLRVAYVGQANSEQVPEGFPDAIMLYLSHIQKIIEEEKPWYKSPWVIAGGAGLGITILGIAVKKRR